MVKLKWYGMGGSLQIASHGDYCASIYNDEFFICWIIANRNQKIQSGGGRAYDAITEARVKKKISERISELVGETGGKK